MKQIWKIVTFTGALWRYYVSIGVFTILLALMNLMQPLLAGFAINELRHGTQANLTYLVWLAIIIFALDLFSNLFSNISGHIGDRLETRLDYLLSHRYYEHLLTLPQQYYDSELTGKIINRLNRSIGQLTNFFQFVTNNFLQTWFSTVFTLIVVFHYSWQAGILMTIVYPIYILLTVRSSGKWQAMQKERNMHLDIASGRFAEVVNQIKVVKSYLQEKRELSVFDEHYQAAVGITTPQSKHWHSNDFYRRLVLNLIFFALYLLIFVQGARGELSPGAVVALILYGNQIRIPLFTISFLVDRFQRAITDSRDYFDILQIEPSITDQPGAKKLVVTDAAIEFKDVTFGYGDQTVLKGISFSVPADSRTALVGESGEGKTTITSLLMRLYDIGSGTITIDGQDISQATQKSLRQSIAVVFQEPALFSGTVRENISYAKPDASEEEIHAAAKAANAHKFISEFEKGYDSEIGERGLKLSGGQKQRLAIARALLKDAPILVLDEATSSLDTRSERVVQEALEHLMKGRTTLIIAHRLSTIQSVDQIVTIRGGSVDEIGSPAKLAKSGGIYQQLLELQADKGDKSKQKLQGYEISG
ncbi:MAG: (1--_2) glucan export composite transrane/ATP-binding protein [Candidatus Saccharibacteria bacterium]|nr:(1-->2) glucan export composite transrane/ATP-binding protein [Candidatus Saccharibacteria bacterium]